MKITHFVTVLIPCFNEAKRINKVLDVVTNSPLVNEVIVINDASTDESEKIILNFKSIKYIKLQQNEGKGNALRQGLTQASGDIIVLSDADVSGFTNQHIKALLDPLVFDQADLVVGINQVYNPLFHRLRMMFYPVSGQRALKRWLLEKTLLSEKSSGWGIELYMNHVATKQNARVSRIALNGVSNPFNIEKYGLLKWVKRLLWLMWFAFKLKIK